MKEFIFLSIVAGSTLETLILTLNPFIGIFFQDFQPQVQNSNTADQLFREECIYKYI